MVKISRVLLGALCWFALVLPSLSVAGDKPTQQELDTMLAPIALYPDSLLSQILMATTYPEQVQKAAQWSKAHPDAKGDDAVKQVQDQGWEASVASLVAFPQVLEMAGNKPEWVAQVGDAFLVDPDAVMDTIQQLRKKANEAGNLKSSDQQKVVVDNSSTQTIIKIESADPQVVYVPTYNPTVVYGTWWWPSYPPYYYYPPGYAMGPVWSGIWFGVGVGITYSIWGNCNWGHGDIDINVNNFNNININKLDVNNIKNSSWKNTSVEQRKSYANNRSNKISQQKRQDYRGRDAQRDKARESMKSRGVDPAKERKELQGAGGDKVRDQVSGRDGGGKIAGGDSKLGGKDKAGQGVGASDMKNKTSRSPSRGSDNAFKDMDRAGGSNRSFDRGTRSTSSNRGGGGGGSRSFGGGHGGGRAGGGRR